MYYGSPLHIINVYKEYDISIMFDIVNSINIPPLRQTLLLCDLNAQNTLWGSSEPSNEGLMWEEFAHGFEIPNSFKYSQCPHIYRCMNVYLWLGPYTVLETLSLPEVWDNFPIITSDIPIPTKKFISRFQDRKAKWPLFQTKLLRFSSDFTESDDKNREASQIIGFSENQPTSRFQLVAKQKIK